MIGVIVPTRGLIFTEVIQAIENLRKHADIKVFYSYDLPIPEAQNYLVEKALADKNISDFLFVEEDVVIPENTIQILDDLQSDIACIDYGVNGWSCTAQDEKGEIYWCGFGCTLVKRYVFNLVEKPWFRVDKSLRLNDWKWIDNEAKYGGQDIWFCMQAREQGCTIAKAKEECRHMKLESLGKPELNRGLHLIKQKPTIEKQQIIKKGGN